MLKTTNINSLNIDGSLITDKSDISNAMNDHFCSVGKHFNKAIPFKSNLLLANKYPVNNNKSLFMFKTMDTRQIEQTVSKMKTSLGSGHDEISSYMLKVSLPVISSSLCHLH